MKNFILGFSILLASTLTAQQTNTFPADGSVGIGTNSPSQKLQVDTSDATVQVQLNRTGPNAGKLDFGVDSAGLHYWVGGYNGFGKEDFFIKANGNIGVGTNAPEGKLHIETDTWSNSLLTFKDTHYSPHQIYNFQVESDGLKIKQNNTINYQFKSGGNFIVNNGSMGIGTTAPSQKLQVDSPISTIQVQLNRTGSNAGKVDYGVDASGLHYWVGGYNGFGKEDFFIKANGKVGIGTNAPEGKLHIETDTWSNSLLTFKDTHYSPHQVYNFQVESDGLKIKQNNTINYQFKSGGNFIVNNGRVGIGTTAPDAKLTVKGKIHAEEVKIDLSVPAPDYVFKKEYDLLTIQEVQQHIQEKGHLPNIPSAKVMETEGVDLGAMNMKLLEKIEELTLYTIEQEKQIQILTEVQKQNTTLEQRVENLEKKIANLLNTQTNEK